MTPSKPQKLTAQQRANKKQTEKRKGQPQYRLQLTEQENELLELLADKFGGKKAAIMKGLQMLDS